MIFCFLTPLGWPIPSCFAPRASEVLSAANGEIDLHEPQATKRFCRTIRAPNTNERTWLATRARRTHDPDTSART